MSQKHKLKAPFLLCHSAKSHEKVYSSSMSHEEVYFIISKGRSSHGSV